MRHLGRPDPPTSGHHNHLPSLQTAPPSHFTQRRLDFGYTMLVSGLCSRHPQGIPEQQRRVGGAVRLPLDPGHESVVLDRACRGSQVEKICAQNQCIGTLMERSDRFGNFTFSFFPLLAPSQDITAEARTTSWKPPGTASRASSFLQLQGQSMMLSMRLHLLRVSDTSTSPVCSVSTDLRGCGSQQSQI